MVRIQDSQSWHRGSIPLSTTSKPCKLLIYRAFCFSNKQPISNFQQHRAFLPCPFYPAFLGSKLFHCTSPQAQKYKKSGAGASLHPHHKPKDCCREKCHSRCKGSHFPPYGQILCWSLPFASVPLSFSLWPTVHQRA